MVIDDALLEHRAEEFIRLGISQYGIALDQFIACYAHIMATIVADKKRATISGDHSHAN